jgi:hypothetical protein
MTDAEMIQITLNHWKMNYPKEFKALGKNALTEATAAVKMTRWEMDALKQVNPGMSDREAWTGARCLFCLKKPYVPEEETPEFKEFWAEWEALPEDEKYPARKRPCPGSGMRTPEELERIREEVERLKKMMPIGGKKREAGEGTDEIEL